MTNDDARHAEEARRFGGNLRAVRMRREDFSQVRLAAEMAALRHKWHPSTVARVESGERRATWMEARDLAAILRVPVDRFTWAPAEEADEAEVARAVSGIREAAEKVRVAVAQLLAARHVGERRAASFRDSRHERVRLAVGGLEADLETITLESATQDGIDTWDEELSG